MLSEERRRSTLLSVRLGGIVGIWILFKSEQTTTGLIKHNISRSLLHIPRQDHLSFSFSPLFPANNGSPGHTTNTTSSHVTGPSYGTYLPATSFKYLQFFFDASIIISMFRRSKHTVRVIVCQNTMNHGGRRRTTAAMVPHSRLRCAETLANRLCNNPT